MLIEKFRHTDLTVGLPPSWGGRSRAFRLLQHCPRWSARSRQRRHLATLGDHALGDIGLTREDVRRETAKPFWRL